MAKNETTKSTDKPAKPLTEREIRDAISLIDHKAKQNIEAAGMSFRSSASKATVEHTDAVGDIARERDANVRRLRDGKHALEIVAHKERDVTIAKAHGEYKRAMAQIVADFESAKTALEVASDGQIMPHRTAIEASYSTAQKNYDAEVSRIKDAREVEIKPLREELKKIEVKRVAAQKREEKESTKVIADVTAAV